MNQIACPHCAFAMEDDGSLAGQEVACSSCGGRFFMPIALVAGQSRPSPRVRSRTRSVPIVAVSCVVLAVCGVGYLLAQSSPIGADSKMRAAAKAFLHDEMPADDWHVVKWWPVKSRPRAVGGGHVIMFSARGTNRSGGKSLLEFILVRLADGTIETAQDAYWEYNRVHDLPNRDAIEKRDNDEFWRTH